MAVELKTKITDDDLLALGPDVNAEVVEGEIIVMTANKMDHTIYGLRIATYLSIFVDTRSLGWVGGDMAAFKLEEYPEGGIKGAVLRELRAPPTRCLH